MEPCFHYYSIIWDGVSDNLGDELQLEQLKNNVQIMMWHQQEKYSMNLEVKSKGEIKYSKGIFQGI